MTRVQPLHVAREDGTVTAVGAWYPSGDVIVQWRREAFPPDERTDASVTSHYQSVKDAEEATGGKVVFDAEHRLSGAEPPQQPEGSE